MDKKYALGIRNSEGVFELATGLSKTVNLYETLDEARSKICGEQETTVIDLGNLESLPFQELLSSLAIKLDRP